MEAQRETVLARSRAELEDLEAKAERERHELLQEIIKVQHERDERLLIAEQEKQRIFGNCILVFLSQYHIDTFPIDKLASYLFLSFLPTLSYQAGFSIISS